MQAVVVSELRKTFRGQVRALQGLSFAIEDGEIFGLLGPNGAGKSTAVRVLATLTIPDSGHAEVAGVDVVAHPALARTKFGLVAQASGVDKELTGHENLVLQAQLHGITGMRARERADALLELVGLGDATNRLARQYSGGMRRRLDIAVGLVHEPKIIFLDEPTTGLDPESRAALWDDMEELRQAAGVAILLTTHYLEEADRLCDRVAIVDRGKVVTEGTPDALKAQIEGDTITIELPEGEKKEPQVNLPDVKEVRRDGRFIHITVPNGAEAVPPLLRDLDAQGARVHSVSVARPTLDDVYLFHTGHTIASAEEAVGEAKRY